MLSVILYIILGITVIFYIFGIYTSSLKVKAKRICSIYKTLKPNFPLIVRSNIEEKEMQKNTAAIYLRTMKIDEEKINVMLDTILPVLEIHK